MGIFVLIRSRENFTNRLWAYFTFCVAIWGWGVFKTAYLTDYQQALSWWKFAHVGVILIPILFIHFLHRFLEKENRILIISAYSIGAFFLIALLTGHLIDHITWILNSFYYNGRPLNPLYLLLIVLWAIATLYSHYLLFKVSKNTVGIKRNQINYFFLATAIGYTGGITCFIPDFGIDLYPYGNLTVPLYPLIMTYAILKYQLLDITIVIRKSIAYSLLITFLTIIYLIAVSLSEKFLQKSIGYHSIWPSLAITFMLGLLFVPIRNKIQTFLDKYFFKASQENLYKENELLRSEVAQTEKFKAIATLASGIAHEIKNPLTAIQTFNEHLPNKKNDPEFFAKYHRIVTQETTRINAMLQELLTFAKPCPPQLESIDPNKILSEIITLVEQNCAANKIIINKQFETSTLIQADPNQLKQALLNIILNAIDAMPDGGSLVIASEVKQSQYIITITDNGCGINPKDLPHIFEPFYTKKEKGTGLGLSITQGIIEKHGGKIHVSSKTNQGTTFTIHLCLK